MLRLHDDLTPPTDGPAWRDFVEWVERLIASYMDTASLPLIERENFQKVQGGLGELEGLDEVEDGPTLDGFRVALDEALGGTAAREGAFGEGVFVAPVGNAVGLRFDKVFLVGMVEGLVPPRVSDDPLLPDQEREQAGLPLRRGTASERYEYLAAASAGRATVLTFARGDTSAQKAQHPSRWFLEEASRLNGSQVFASTLADRTKSSWLDVVESQEGGLRKIGLSQPADSPRLRSPSALALAALRQTHRRAPSRGVGERSHEGVADEARQERGDADGMGRRPLSGVNVLRAHRPFRAQGLLPFTARRVGRLSVPLFSFQRHRHRRARAAGGDNDHLSPGARKPNPQHPRRLHLGGAEKGNNSLTR